MAKYYKCLLTIAIIFFAVSWRKQVTEVERIDADIARRKGRQKSTPSSVWKTMFINIMSLMMSSRTGVGFVCSEVELGMVCWHTTIVMLGIEML
jgi:hypothetical protein